MDVGFTLIVKFGERGIARKCSLGYKREELLNYVVSKWPVIVKEDIFMSYDLLGSGELDLADEEDMATMLRLMEEIQMRKVNVYIRRLNAGLSSGMGSTCSNSCKELVQVNRDVGEGSGLHKGDLRVVGGERLRSDDWRHLITRPGQRFPDGAWGFRRALIKYSVQMGFEFRYVKNCASRVTAVCARHDSGCPWRIHAVRELVDKAFRISTYERNHSCDSVFGNVGRKRINFHIITEMIMEDLRSMPSLTPVQIMAMVKKNYGIDISYCVAWKSMDRGRSLVFGDHASSFGMLPMYLDELVKANHGSHVHLDIGEDNKFRRCFFSFGACLMGFKQCRPMLMVDGTFLKGRHRGVLLSAVAKDGDEGNKLCSVTVIFRYKHGKYCLFFCSCNEWFLCLLTWDVGALV